MVRGGVYLFITQRPSVVSGGHGNTCPGPFSTGLVVARFSPAKALSPQLLGSLLLSIPSIYCFAFGSGFGLHAPFSRRAQPYLSSFGSFSSFLLFYSLDLIAHTVAHQILPLNCRTGRFQTTALVLNSGRRVPHEEKNPKTRLPNRTTAPPVPQ